MIELLHRDNMKYMRTLPDQAFDLAIVDPPYFDGPNKLGYYGETRSRTGVKREAYKKTKHWKLPSKAFFRELGRVSRHQIVWGANHFISRMPYNSPAWIVWDKCNEGTSFSDVELAWTSFDRAARLFPFMWNGMCQGLPSNGRVMQGNKALNEKRIHPTQKPVALYRWLLQNYAEKGWRILDTHLGSGSSALAAEVEGFDFVGMDIDPVHVAGAIARLEEHRHLPLFNPPQQASLIL